MQRKSLLVGLFAPGCGAAREVVEVQRRAAGAGVMLHLQRIESEWLPITVALVVSTFAGMAVTAWVIVAMTRKHKQAAGKTL